MPTFVLGVGAQKAGTTWLHANVASNDSAEFGFRKEYHIFDALEIKECKGFFMRSLQRMKKVQVANLPDTSAGAILSQDDFRHFSFYMNSESYFDYFQGLLGSDDTIRLTGDITPTYSALSVATLEKIRRGFSARGIKVKVVFLMRDPVERAWSAVRNARLDLAGRHPARLVSVTEEMELDRKHASKSFLIRGRYDATLQRLATAFPAEDVFVSIYEKMLFEPQEYQRFSDFLGLALDKPDFGRKVNPSEKTDQISDRVRAQVARRYSDVYSYVRRAHPGLEIDRYWDSARFVS